MSDWHFCACYGPLFDYKLAHVSGSSLKKVSLLAYGREEDQKENEVWIPM